MATSIQSIIKAITELNNCYRDPASSTRTKLEALWEIGESLTRLGVAKPHSMGWAVQRETRGLIKRPTIFRSHKIRTIWPSKEDLIRDLGTLRGLSILTELLPLVDPAQDVKHKLSNEQLKDLYSHACTDEPGEFKSYLGDLKKRFSHGKLGKTLDRNKHLGHLQEVVSSFKRLRNYLASLYGEKSLEERESFRSHTSLDELQSFSNMCIALTTRDNYRLYRRLASDISSSQNQEFKHLYEHFRRILNSSGDVKRARLRRLISPEAMAEVSDMISSIVTETTVEDFKERRKLAIPL